MGLGVERPWSLGNEFHRHAVDAIAQMGRWRPILEHVAEMAAATAAMHFIAHHAVAVLEIERAASGRFGTVLAHDSELLGRENLAPFGVRVGDGIAFCHLILRYCRTTSKPPAVHRDCRA